ncbi:hypothetical protein [Cloacibacterium caeni]|uniref:hypothetical protein n=1 Tax=Cloacibacterium caeni TaxID=2004710 RepID=UPI001BD0834A|nr:hypothetical protein [Cloacibacterium caeni]
MTTNNKHNIENTSKKIEISSFSKELLLIIFGALIGILVNQIFFKQNKDYEMKVELQKDLLKEQYQYLNRILQFTHKYEITEVIEYIQPIKVIQTIDTKTNKVIKTENIEMEKKLKNSFTLPSFIISENKRNTFLNDLNYIKDNRDKIDHNVYNKFDELLQFISENPFPKGYEKSDYEKTMWKTEKTQEKWNKKISELYEITYSKLYY